MSLRSPPGHSQRWQEQLLIKQEQRGEALNADRSSSACCLCAGEPLIVFDQQANGCDNTSEQPEYGAVTKSSSIAAVLECLRTAVSGTVARDTCFHCWTSCTCCTACTCLQDAEWSPCTASPHQVLHLESSGHDQLAVLRAAVLHMRVQRICHTSTCTWQSSTPCAFDIGSRLSAFKTA